jgi:hypothetical protein
VGNTGPGNQGGNGNAGGTGNGDRGNSGGGIAPGRAPAPVPLLIDPPRGTPRANVK